LTSFALASGCDVDWLLGDRLVITLAIATLQRTEIHLPAPASCSGDVFRFSTLEQATAH
jgi:hypothetical protein